MHATDLVRLKQRTWWVAEDKLKHQCRSGTIIGPLGVGLERIERLSEYEEWGQTSDEFGPENQAMKRFRYVLYSIESSIENTFLASNSRLKSVVRRVKQLHVGMATTITWLKTQPQLQALLLPATPLIHRIYWQILTNKIFTSNTSWMSTYVTNLDQSSTPPLVVNINLYPLSMLESLALGSNTNWYHLALTLILGWGFYL